MGILAQQHTSPLFYFVLCLHVFLSLHACLRHACHALLHARKKRKKKAGMMKEKKEKKILLSLSPLSLSLPLLSLPAYHSFSGMATLAGTLGRGQNFGTLKSTFPRPHFHGHGRLVVVVLFTRTCLCHALHRTHHLKTVKRPTGQTLTWPRKPSWRRGWKEEQDLTSLSSSLRKGQGGED